MEKKLVVKQNVVSVSGVATPIEQCKFTWSFKSYSAYPKPSLPLSTQGLIVRCSEAWESIDSASFSTGIEVDQKASWRLILCPCKVVKSEEYVGIYLQKISGNHAPQVEFKISLLSDCSDHTRSQNGSYVFRKSNFYGWDNFILRKELIDEQNCFLINGTLRVCCEMTLEYDIEIDFGKIESQETSHFNSDIVSINSAFLNVSTVFKDLYESKACSDVILQIGKVKLSAHKAILCAHSPVFARIFKHHMKKSDGNCIKIDDVSAEVIERMLRYIYCGELSDGPIDGLIGLYKCADKYKVLSLVRNCSSVLAFKMNAEIACDVLVIAHLSGDTSLLNSAKNFVVRKPLDIMNSEKWIKLVQDYPELTAEIIKDKQVDGLLKRIAVIERSENSPMEFSFANPNCVNPISGAFGSDK